MKLGPEQSGFTSRLTRLALWPFRQKFTVGSLVHIESRTGEILLVQQRLRRGSCWGLPGGFQCPGEDQQQTAIREVREETSLDVSQMITFVAHYQQPWAHHYDNLFRAQLTDKPAPKATLGSWLEIKDVRWFDPDALPGLTREAREALRRLPEIYS